MTKHHAPRFVSFALAALVTWSMVVGIDTLALEQHAAAMQMSQAPAATQTAAVPVAPRS